MKTSSSLTAFVFLIYIFNGSESAGPKRSINSTFVATEQWKKVEDGQVLPPGLHVRINLHTGEKEAKLPDADNGENRKSLIATKTGDVEEPEATSSLDPTELKKLLKNIKPDDGASDVGVKKKFKSYEKLKEEFKKLKVQIKSDYEILVSLIDGFKTFNLRTKHANNISSEWTKDDDILAALVDLEYLVHQYDNALNFAKLNGFSEVVYKSLNSSSSEIRSEALKLLGSATQSNPNVQIAALESGSINLLIKILIFDENINVRSRSLYALSCLTRRFPAAQQKLIADGGLTAFAKIFDDEKQNLLKLQIKIITLIHDLIFERKDTKMSILNEESRHYTEAEMESLRDKLRQYEKINLEQKLVQQEWCKRISDWFLKQNYIKELIVNANVGLTLENINFDTQGVIEEVVDTLYVLSDICKTHFQSDVDLVDLLFTLRDLYGKLALEESAIQGDSNQFYSSLSNILKILTNKLAGTTTKDEL